MANISAALRQNPDHAYSEMLDRLREAEGAFRSIQQQLGFDPHGSSFPASLARRKSSGGLGLATRVKGNIPYSIKVNNPTG